MTHQSSNEIEELSELHYTYSSIEKMYNTNCEQGLNSQQIAAEKLGLNIIVTKKPNIWKLYFAPLFDVLITIYIIMALVLFLLSQISGDNQGKVTFWLVVVAINMIMAIYQQYRAQKKLEALKNLSSPKARVVRDGELTEIDAKNIVCGDKIVLKTGDQVPADGILISSGGLKVNEASLTGEPIPVRKKTIINSPKEFTPASKIYLGTFIQEGNGACIVTAIGNQTELGKIASSMSAIDSLEIPLRSKVNVLGKWLGFTMICFLGILFTHTLISRLRLGEDLSLFLLINVISWSIINAMAVMPINIPLLSTVVLLSGVLNMANQKVVIKKLSAVESLGRSSVLCSDKTGTITTAQMSVKFICVGGILIHLDNNNNQGYSSKKVENHSTALEVTNSKLNENSINKNIINNLLLNAVNNNSAIMVDSSDNGFYQGNTTDVALKQLQSLLSDSNIDKMITTHTFHFDSSIKRMSTIMKSHKTEQRVLFCKGAPEILLSLCEDIYLKNEIVRLTPKIQNELLTEITLLSNQGYRIIGFAQKQLDTINHEVEINELRDQFESALTFYGYAILYDPPRDGVREAVLRLKEASVKPIMITGDALPTAKTIAKQVEIMSETNFAYEGKEIENLTDDEFFQTAVFARVTPSHKELIVRRYKELGNIVTMTGDGVNDAIALSRSNTGVAMGIAGTEVAKEAADVIIMDDSYVSLAKGVEEGRNLYEKIRIMIFFYIAVNLAEAMMYFTFSLDIGFQVLNNYQRSYIFTIVHAIPVFAIIFGPNNLKIMKNKPKNNDNLLPRNLALLLVTYSILLAFLLVGFYNLYYQQVSIFDINQTNLGGITSYLNIGDLAENDLDSISLAHAKARTILLSIIYISETLLVLSIVRINHGVITALKEMNGFVFICVLGPLVMHFGIMYITGLQLYLYQIGFRLEIIPLSPVDLVIVFIAGLCPLVFIEFLKKVYRHQNIEL